MPLFNTGCWSILRQKDDPNPSVRHTRMRDGSQRLARALHPEPMQIDLCEFRLVLSRNGNELSDVTAANISFVLFGIAKLSTLLLGICRFPRASRMAVLGDARRSPWTWR